jgi:insulysin
VYVEAFVHGNTDEGEAILLFKTVTASLGGSNLLTSDMPDFHQRHLPTGVHLYQLAHPNPSEINSATQLLYQFGTYSITKNALLMLFADCFKHPAFNQLRTQEQLGYLVSSHMTTYTRAHALSMQLSVQSSTKDPVALQERMQLFVAGFVDVIRELTPEAFEAQKASLLIKIRKKPESIFNFNARLWQEIECGAYVFDRTTRLENALQDVTKDHVSLMDSERLTS